MVVMVIGVFHGITATALDMETDTTLQSGAGTWQIPVNISIEEMNSGGNAQAAMLL